MQTDNDAAPSNQKKAVSGEDSQEEKLPIQPYKFYL